MAQPGSELPEQDDRGLRALEAFVKAVSDFQAFGSVKVGKQQQVTLRKPAREALRLEQNTHYYVYGSPQLGLALVVGEPLSASADFLARVRGRSIPAAEAARRDQPLPDETDVNEQAGTQAPGS